MRMQVQFDLDYLDAKKGQGVLWRLALHQVCQHVDAVLQQGWHVQIVKSL